MPRHVAVAVSLLVVAAVVPARLGSAQASSAQAPAQQSFEPKVGQAGKDVVWVPTPSSLLALMLDMAQLSRFSFN